MMRMLGVSTKIRSTFDQTVAPPAGLTHPNDTKAAAATAT
jgi:hypothetical protein